MLEGAREEAGRVGPGRAGRPGARPCDPQASRLASLLAFPAAQAQASCPRQASAAPGSLHKPGSETPPGPAPQALPAHLPRA